VGHWGDCRHLPNCQAAADPHPHPRCFWLPQLVAELGPLGELFAVSQATNAPPHSGDGSPVLMVVGKALGVVAVGQLPDVVAVGFARPSPGLAQVT